MKQSIESLLEQELDLSRYPTLRRLAAHDRVHAHESVGQSCLWCDMDSDLRALVAQEHKRGFELGVSRAREIISFLANWSFNGTDADYPSNVLDKAAEALLDVYSGALWLERWLP